MPANSNVSQVDAWPASGAWRQVPSGPGGRPGLRVGRALAPGLGDADGGCGRLDALQGRFDFEDRFGLSERLRLGLYGTDDP